jgi:hypothetical protein
MGNILHRGGNRLRSGTPGHEGRKQDKLWRQGIVPETIPAHLPHLTLAQVFDALSYYSDHQEAINQYIEHNQIPDTVVDPLVHGS